MPDSIQGIIAARMDRLEDQIKRTMQVASVIGRNFAYRILQTITGAEEELKSYLLSLQNLEFIYEKSLFPELEYIFRHALTEEVAYSSILLQKRKQLHERIGRAIEQIYGKRLKGFLETLAYHYSKSDNFEKAYHYTRLSGDKALSEAVKINRSITLGLCESYLGIIHSIRGEGVSAKDHFEKGIRYLEEVQFLQPLATTWTDLGYAHFLLGEPESGIECAKKGLKVQTRTGSEWFMSYHFRVLGICSFERGKHVRAREQMEEALDQLRKAEGMFLKMKMNYWLKKTGGILGSHKKNKDQAGLYLAEMAIANMF